MDKKKITERVTALVTPIVEAAGLELVDVEYVRERDWFLRVFIDKEGGIDIDDCSAVSNALAKNWMKKTSSRKSIIWKSLHPVSTVL